MNDYVLEVKNVSKAFPGVQALDNVSLYLKPGEIHALVGENGAGKSTLMKILAGIYPMDSGELFIEGKPFHPKNPMDALLKGVSMVHQELDLIPDMTVEENVFCGRELNKGLKLNKKKMIQLTQETMKSLGINIKPEAKIKSLSTAQQQMVAITRAIAFDAKVIIMDEPTSAITDREVAKLFEIINKLKSQNKAIVYISHKMDEIYTITQRITVFRDGQLIGTGRTEDIPESRLVNMMVGRELTQVYVKNQPKTVEFDDKEILLKVDNLSREGEFYNVSFEVKRGEILGVFGLMGAGRTEVMNAVFGITKPDTGTIISKGKKITSINQAINSGMAYITEDRKLTGLNLIASVKDNITMAYIGMITKKSGVLNLKKERGLADQMIDRLNVKTPSRDTIVGTLSGGNQQKVVLAKWFLGNPDILIMDEPTRGIDIGAKGEIYALMDKLVKQGKGIIMISSETPELLGMSDRVIVMHEGYITGEFSKDELDQNKLMQYAIGMGNKEEAMEEV